MTPTPAEMKRLTVFGRPRYDATFTVAPATGSPLATARGTFERGAFAEMLLGRAQRAMVPACFCDACAEEGDDLVEDFGGYVNAVVEGFREYRRAESGGLVQGFEWSGGGQGTGSGAPAVDLWEVDWPAWPSRSAGHLGAEIPRV